MKTIFQALKDRYCRYVLRTCRYRGKWASQCGICEEDIKRGEQYYDGGTYGHRAHEECVNPTFI